MEATEVAERKEDGGELTVKINVPSKPGQFIRPIGSDIKEGQVIVDSGDCLGPAEIGLLAGAGTTACFPIHLLTRNN